MVVAFRSVRQGLAAFSAPARRLLLVVDIMLVEFCNIPKGFTTFSTLAPKLLLYGTPVRLGARRFVEFLLPRSTLVRDIGAFELGEEFLAVDCLVEFGFFWN